MGKKRKLEGMPETADSEELISNQEEEKTLNEESVAPFSIDPRTEESWEPEIDESINEQLLVEADAKPEDLEATDLGPNTSGVSDSLPADSHEDDEDNDPASLQKLIEPFSKDQLSDLLRDAALKHPDVWASIRETADADPSHRKIFVHGLGWNATTETLIDTFRQFGEIEDCKAIVDKATGRSKGYGFVIFKNRSSARRALKDPQKKIGNKMTACQLASEGPPPISSASSFIPAPAVPAFIPAQQPNIPPVSEYTQRKIYVSNVGADLDPQKVMEFFSKFGEIEEGPLGLDKDTGKLKGFCLFVFKNVDSARKALEEPHKNFEGHILHCQKAIDGPKINKHGMHIHHGGGKFKGGKQGQRPQFRRIDTSVPMGGVPSSGGGPGHLIAPPAVSVRFNQAGQPNSSSGVGYNPALVKNGGFVAKPAFGNQAVGAGSFMNPNVVGAYGPSLRIHGNYGSTAMGQGNAWTQQSFSHMGGVATSTAQ